MSDGEAGPNNIVANFGGNWIMVRTCLWDTLDIPEYGQSLGKIFTSDSFISAVNHILVLVAAGVSGLTGITSDGSSVLGSWANVGSVCDPGDAGRETVGPHWSRALTR